VSGCCTSCNQPVGAFGTCPCGFTRVSALSNSLVQSLTPCVDKIRDLYTCLGARVYEVAIVKTRWSGGERGVGVEQVVSEELILPTPRISDLTSLSASTQAIGQEEFGSIEVSQISPRYTEDFLAGREEGGAELPSDMNVYWEIRIPGSERRRFVLNSPPNLSPLKFEWTVRLEKAFENRARNRDPRA